MAQKYFHAENAGRGLVGGVIFTIYATLAGTHFGVYTTASDDEAALIEGAMKTDKSITTISREEYEQALQKKRNENSAIDYQSLQRVLPVDPNPKPTSLKGTGAAVVINAPPEEERPAEVKTTFDDPVAAVKTGKPAPAPKAPPAPPKK
jgi:hypothetical protein